MTKEDPDEAKPYQEDVIELADEDVRGDNSATTKQEAKSELFFRKTVTNKQLIRCLSTVEIAGLHLTF